MRVDAAAPRTWLLAAVAAWALLTWMLALAGMGGHIAPLPADPALQQALPTPKPSPPDRLGPLAQYREVGDRPLFSENRRPQAFVLQPEGEEGTPANNFDYVLSSVLITPQVRLAIVQPTNGGKSVSFRLGESTEDLPNWRLVSLNPRSAVFEGPGGTKSLDLRVWPGGARQGGAAPVPQADNTMVNADAAAPIPAPPPANAMPVPAPPASTGGRLGEEAATDEDKKDEEARAKQQMDAIRKRIEERRAQLRREAQQQPPGSTPPE